MPKEDGRDYEEVHIQGWPNVDDHTVRRYKDPANNNDKEETLLKMSHELIEALQEIKLVCEKAKAHYIEESDIDEILEIAKRHV